MLYEATKRKDSGVLYRRESGPGCVWNDTAEQESLPCASDVDGRRKSCLSAVDLFLDAVDRSLTEELLYCQCDGLTSDSSWSPLVARACKAMMGALKPACSVVELPPANCADLLQRCLSDAECRSVLLLLLFKN